MTCCSDETLNQYLAGDLPSRQQEEVAAHLNSCVKCEERLAVITGVPELDDLRRRFGQQLNRPASPEQVSRSLRDRLLAIPHPELVPPLEQHSVESETGSNASLEKVRVISSLLLASISAFTYFGVGHLCCASTSELIVDVDSPVDLHLDGIPQPQSVADNGRYQFQVCDGWHCLSVSSADGIENNRRLAIHAGEKMFVVVRGKTAQEPMSISVR